MVVEGFTSKDLDPLAAPAPSVTPVNKEGDVGLVEESNHSLSMALAAAAAAEATIAVAHAATKVVEFTGTSLGCQQWKREADEPKITNIHEVAAPVTPRIKQEVQESSAIKIQTAFRGFLARKALRALKGIVKLQAIIRGRTVQCQLMTTPRRLQSIVDIHSQVCATRSHVLRVKTDFNENCQIKHIVGKKVKCCYRRWDDSLLSREDVKPLRTSKREAVLRRERIKEYAFNHRPLFGLFHSEPGNGLWKKQKVDAALQRCTTMKSFLEETLDAIPDLVLDSAIAGAPCDFTNESLLANVRDRLPPPYDVRREKEVVSA